MESADAVVGVSGSDSEVSGSDFFVHSETSVLFVTSSDFSVFILIYEIGRGAHLGILLYR